METRLKPVPAFYCCYLLRSTVRRSSLYIGSSPHPARRLAQHNGKVKGGAVRTSRHSLQPWEMVCVVAGFPSNIAALQFEWAWHNAHLTKHISPEDRMSVPTTKTKTDRRTGKTRSRPGRPRKSLLDHLSNLHLLLRASYFSKWPLTLRFWNEDVHKSWLAWDHRASEQIRPQIEALLDLPQNQGDNEELRSAQKPAKKRKVDQIGKGGVEGVDPTYAKFQSVLQKAKDLTEGDESIPLCDVCGKDIDVRKNLFNICLGRDCHSLTHMSCLSARFLDEEGSDLMLPIKGTCPSCKTMSQWLDLMRVLSLRTRDQKQVQKLLKKRNRGAAAVAAEILEDSEDSGFEEEQSDGAGSNENPEIIESDSGDDTSVDSILSFWSERGGATKAIPSASQPQRLEMVIEDSEDER